MLRIVVSLYLLFGLIGTSALADPRPMTPVDFIEIPRLSEPSLSPDGRYLAYLQTETRWSDNKIVERLKLIDTSTGAQLPTPDFGEELAHASEIWWGPYSDRFIYLKKVGDKKKSQAHLFDAVDARK